MTRAKQVECGARAECEAREECAGGVVLRRAGGALEVALAEQHDRNLGVPRVRLPKGHIGAGESAEQAARREVLEETGLEARVLEALGAVSYSWVERGAARRTHKRVQFFLMAWERGAAHPRDGEMSRVFWVPLTSATARLDFDTEREVLARACARVKDWADAFPPAP